MPFLIAYLIIFEYYYLKISTKQSDYCLSIKHLNL